MLVMFYNVAPGKYDWVGHLVVEPFLSLCMFLCLCGTYALTLYLPPPSILGQTGQDLNNDSDILPP